MKNKRFKILGIILVIALVATLFCACDFLNFLSEITEVKIIAGDGLIKVADGEYTVYADKQFYLSASWDNKRVGNPSIEWHTIDENGIDRVCAYKGKDFGYAYSIGKIGVSETYYASIGDVESEKIKITVIETPLEAPTITSTTHTVSNGIVQQNIVSGLSDIVLCASWNENGIAQNRNVEIAWFVDGVLQEGEKSKQFTFCVDSIYEECQVVVRAVLYEDGAQKTSTEIVLDFVNHFDMVDNVTLAVTDNLHTIGNAYYVERTSGAESGCVKMVCNILPRSANQSADCIYNITTSSGTTQTVGSSPMEIPLAYGKNVITATVQNVESRSVIIYYLDYAYDNIPADIKTAIENTFFFNGNYHDCYISTQADANAFMGYAVAQHLTEIDFNVYLADVSFRTQDAFKTMLSTAVAQGVDESGSFVYSLLIADNGVGTVAFYSSSRFGKASGAYESVTDTKQIKSYVRYSEVEQKRTSLPIDNATEEMSVANSNDLYRAVMAGYKPVFSANESGVKLSQLYQKARDVLLTYISADMSELDKVAAIYDWIVSEVDYDYAVATAAEADKSKDTNDYNAFYLEGVFEDHRAVCDGKSKAFALLCGMEGIRCVRVCGYANRNITAYSKDALEGTGFGHAWNKVLVDVDGDGIREWYNVDTTWGDSGVDSDKTKFEYLNYAYFLKTDEEMESTHVEKSIAPKTTTQKYDVYKNTFIEINGKTVSLYIDSVATADALLKYSSKNGKIALSVCDENNILNSAHIGYSYVKCADGQYVIYALN